jgi:hypothetical protein
MNTLNCNDSGFFDIDQENNFDLHINLKPLFSIQKILEISFFSTFLIHIFI